MRSFPTGARSGRLAACLVLVLALPGCKDKDTTVATEVPAAPTAAAPERILLVRCSADPVEGLAPVAVRFNPDIAPRGDGATYAWAFGDGGTSALASPEHVYTVPGTYQPRLTAARAGTTGSCTAPTVYVYGTLAATCRSELLGGTSVHFRVLPSFCLFDRCSYSWDFGGAGGGSGLTGPRPDFTYSTAGTYTARATVSSAGQSASCSETVTVP